MNLYIPAIGDIIVLTQDWSFTVYPEQRNVAMYAYLGFADEARCIPQWGHKGVKVNATLEANTTLQIERLYIRKNQEEFDSITFVVPGVKVDVPYEDRVWDANSSIPTIVTKTKSRPLRFWVKLKDANTIQFTPK